MGLVKASTWGTASCLARSKAPWAMSMASSANPREGLHGHGRQDIAAELDVPARADEAEGLDEVPLGHLMLPDVEGRPAGQLGEFGADGEQLAAGLVGERAWQQRDSLLFQAGREGVRPPVPTLIFGSQRRASSAASRSSSRSRRPTCVPLR